jgi:hypothetical protein
MSSLTFDQLRETLLLFVAKYPGLDRCLLGRAGWLQRGRMNLIAYDNLLYLDLHGQEQRQPYLILIRSVFDILPSKVSTKSTSPRPAKLPGNKMLT